MSWSLGGTLHVYEPRMKNEVDDFISYHSMPIIY